MVSKNSANTGHIRHLAFQIVAQLPEDVADALLVLAYARRMIEQEFDLAPVAATLKIVKKEP